MHQAHQIPFYADAARAGSGGHDGGDVGHDLECGV
jgi:hypothetical protein